MIEKSFTPKKPKGYLKKKQNKNLPLLSKEAGSKAAAIPLVCVLSGAGWLKPQAFEEEMPSKVQAASQPPESSKLQDEEGEGGHR